MYKKILGQHGESIARKIYQKEFQHRLIAQNLRTPFGEIDLITTDDKYLYFIEVKVSSSNHFGTAYQKWFRSQRIRLQNSINYLISQQILIDPDLIKVHFITFDLSKPPKVRLRRFLNVPLNL